MQGREFMDRPSRAAAEIYHGLMAARFMPDRVLQYEISVPVGKHLNRHSSVFYRHGIITVGRPAQAPRQRRRCPEKHGAVVPMLDNRGGGMMHMARHDQIGFHLSQRIQGMGTAENDRPEILIRHFMHRMMHHAKAQGRAGSFETISDLLQLPGRYRSVRPVPVRQDTPRRVDSRHAEIGRLENGGDIGADIAAIAAVRRGHAFYQVITRYIVVAGHAEKRRIEAADEVARAAEFFMAGDLRQVAAYDDQVGRCFPDVPRQGFYQFRHFRSEMQIR